MSVFLFFHAYLPFLQLDQNLKISFCPSIAFTECNRNRNPSATFRVAPFFCFLSFLFFSPDLLFLHLGRKTLKFCFPQTLQLLSSKFKCLGYFLPILRRIKPGLPVAQFYVCHLFCCNLVAILLCFHFHLHLHFSLSTDMKLALMLNSLFQNLQLIIVPSVSQVYHPSRENHFPRHHGRQHLLRVTLPVGLRLTRISTIRGA